jgi:hypothetical protein
MARALPGTSTLITEDRLLKKDEIINFIEIRSRRVTVGIIMARELTSIYLCSGSSHSLSCLHGRAIGRMR